MIKARKAGGPRLSPILVAHRVAKGLLQCTAQAPPLFRLRAAAASRRRRRRGSSTTATARRSCAAAHHPPWEALLSSAVTAPPCTQPGVTAPLPSNAHSAPKPHPLRPAAPQNVQFKNPKEAENAVAQARAQELLQRMVEKINEGVVRAKARSSAADFLFFFLSAYQRRPGARRWGCRAHGESGRGMPPGTAIHSLFPPERCRLSRWRFRPRRRASRCSCG